MIRRLHERRVRLAPPFPTEGPLEHLISCRKYLATKPELPVEGVRHLTCQRLAPNFTSLIPRPLVVALEAKQQNSWDREVSIYSFRERKNKVMSF